jgi:hypothetical protein
MLFLPQDFTTNGMRISHQNGVEHIIVSFFQRNKRFTSEEEHQLKEAGAISLFGHLQGHDHLYGISPTGENHLFRNKEDLDLFMKNSLL